MTCHAFVLKRECCYRCMMKFYLRCRRVRLIVWLRPQKRSWKMWRRLGARLWWMRSMGGIGRRWEPFGLGRVVVWGLGGERGPSSAAVPPWGQRRCRVWRGGAPRDDGGSGVWWRKGSLALHGAGLGMTTE